VFRIFGIVIDVLKNMSYIELVSVEDVTTEITITDTHGNVVSRNSVESFDGSLVSLNENLNLLPGIYNIQITSDLSTAINA
jgi:hypothetical protein